MNRKKLLASKRLIIALLALLLIGCTAAPVYKGVAVANESGYVLGIAVDEDLQVVEIAPESAAAVAGVEVGDTLISLSWILSEAPEDVPTSPATGVVTASIAPLTTTLPPKLPPAGIEAKTVQFTDGDEIRTLASYGVPLRIHLIRQGQDLELTIIPAPLAGTPESSSTLERF